MKRVPKAFLVGVALGVLAVLPACETEIDVYAPPIEAYSVVCVLNPLMDTQFVKLAPVFQSPGDAYAYADSADLDVHGWHVTLQSDSTVWRGAEILVPKDEGIFGADYQTVYAIPTAGNHSLAANQTYTLTLRKGTDSSYVIRAQAYIPSIPTITSPSGPSYHAPSNTYSLPTMDFERDLQIRFIKGSGFGFEVRVYAALTAGDGSIQERNWGPSTPRTVPVRCEANSLLDEMCIFVPAPTVPNYFHTQVSMLPPPVKLHDTLRVAQSPSLLSMVSKVEVTAIDSNLAKYLIGTDGGNYGLNMLMDKREYSNMPAPHNGIFGGINTHFRWVFFSGCTKFKMGLVPTGPPGC